MQSKIMKESLEAFFDEKTQWSEIFEKLREIFLELKLDEELKWGKACYCESGANIAILQGFKNYCAILFPKGALMADPEGLLIAMSENTQAARQMRFTHVCQVTTRKDVIEDYIKEAVRVELSGEKVDLKETSDYEVPDELEKAFIEDSEFREAFHKLTPGRQRGYLLHFSQAKQSSTRADRIEKYRERIFDGLGINDK